MSLTFIPRTDLILKWNQLFLACTISVSETASRIYYDYAFFYIKFMDLFDEDNVSIFEIGAYLNLPVIVDVEMVFVLLWATLGTTARWLADHWVISY